MPLLKPAFYDPFEAQQCLEQAGAPTYERIDTDDQRQLSWQTQLLLGAIRKALFDADLSVAKLLRSCNLRGSHHQARFHREIGCSLGRYLADSRLETAVRLLRDSHLPVPDIALLVGYAHPQTLSDALERWTGLRTAELRGKTRLAASRAPEPDPYQLSLWHRLRAGKVEPEQRYELLVRLKRLYPLPGVAEEHGDRQRRVHAATNAATAVWNLLVTLPLADQRDLVSGIAFHTPVLFHLLGKKSLAEGRTDRRRGIFLARLALASLGASREPLDDAYHDLRALGWARLGNAWRLANRYCEAEEAFARAEDAWAAERLHVDRHAEAEILRLKSSLRQYQRRFSDALELVSRATALCRLAGDRSQLVYCSVQRASIYVYGGQPRVALPVLSEADQLAGQQLEEPELRLFVLQVSAGVHTLLGDYTAAKQLLPTVLQLCEELNRPDGTCQVRWLQGLVSRDRGRLEQAAARLAEAHSGFVTLGDMDSAAMVALDAAELHLRCGRTWEVVRLAAESIPVFEALELDREGLATLALLREAVTADAVTRSVLRELRERFAQLFPDSLTALLAAGSGQADSG